MQVKRLEKCNPIYFSQSVIISVDNAVNSLGMFCRGKYQITCHLHDDTILNDFDCSKIIELGDVEYGEDTRLITMGYNKNKNEGFFLDTLYPQKYIK